MNRILQAIPNCVEFCATTKTLSVADLARMELDHCNPTVPQAAEICALTGKDIYDLYDPADLDYTVLHTPKPAKTKQDNPRITHRVTPAQFRQVMADLDTCGYATVGDWLQTTIRTLHNRAERIKKKEATE